MEGKWIFTVACKVAPPILVGLDGRRQLIPVLEGTVEGDGFTGEILPGGVDSQVIRPDGVCELSARYAVKMDDGSTIYIENNGIRTVPDDCVDKVLNGEFIDPSLYYFCTTPKVEVYGDKFRWLEKKVLYCDATREPDRVFIKYYALM